LSGPAICAWIRCIRAFDRGQQLDVGPRVAIGACLGLPLALMATRVIKHQLFAMDAVDPTSFAVALGVVSLMTVIAGWLPARRAARVDPVTALRCE